MQLHCLGTVGYHPNDSRHTSCYFLPESGILLDAGSGLFRLAPLIQTDSLDILLSHSHLDHVFGLTFLLDTLYECEHVYGRPIGQIRIWGEAKKLAAVRDHLFHELLFPAALDAQWNEIDDLENFPIADVDVAWRQQDHPGGSVAYRLDWRTENKRLVYATDTTGDLSDEHAKWSTNADLLVHECYFRDEAAKWAMKTGHSWTQRVADVAAKSKPRQLLVTHINPIENSDDPIELEALQDKLNAEVEVAHDGLVVDF